MNTSIPEWLGTHYIDDATLADAYAAVPDERRALLKTAIARLWEWYGPSRSVSSFVERRMRGGLSAREARKPVDLACVVCGESMASPAQLLAAVVPTVAAGARDVLVVKSRSAGWTTAQLVALELAGIERIAELEPDEISTLVREMAPQKGAVSLLFVDAPDAENSVTAHSSELRPLALRQKGAVLFQESGGAQFDLEALAFGQAGTPMTCIGEAGEVDHFDFSCENRGFDYILTLDAQVAFLPVQYHAAAMERFNVIMGPGFEACWLWPEITIETFMDTRVCWTDGERV